MVGNYKSIQDVIINDILPQALMMGVNYNDFWDLTPKTLKPFVKAFTLKREYDDEMMWMQGMYFTMAIGSCFSKQSKYPKQPLSKGKIEQEDIKGKFLRQMEVLNSRFKGSENDAE